VTATPDAAPHPAPGARDPDLWFFIVAELMMFGAFFIVYVVYRATRSAFRRLSAQLDRSIGRSIR